MDYIVAIIISLLLPPVLIGITSSSDKTDKNISIGIVSMILLFIQINWGRKIISFNILAIIVTVIVIVLAIIYRKHFLKTLNILANIFKNYLKELQDPLLSTKDTVGILYKKDIAVVVLTLFRLIKPMQGTILILGTFVYLAVVEMILQDNTELKSSWESLIDNIRTLGGLNREEQEDEVYDVYEEEYEEFDEEELEDSRVINGENNNMDSLRSNRIRRPLNINKDVGSSDKFRNLKNDRNIGTGL